jgi:acetoin utilization deacetylase AcuC-like enzyme
MMDDCKASDKGDVLNKFLFALIFLLQHLVTEAQLMPLSKQSIQNVLSDQGPKVAVLYDEAFLLHDTGVGHPERPERLEFVVNKIQLDQALSKHLYWPKVKLASNNVLQMVHQKDYIQLVENEIGQLKLNEVANLSTGDTVISPNTLNAAKLAAGAGVTGVDEIMNGKATAAFALVRPPGHHATATRGMGFCVYNNVAIAAKYVQKHYGVKRVLIVDFDVHHGNGTQEIFYEDDSVFYFSVHQSPLYPGTGNPLEIGKGKGVGFNLNVALEKGAGDQALLAAFEGQLKPAMKQFKPEFIIVSAGFDSHAGDLLGGLNYSDDGYVAIARILNEVAAHYASGHLLYMLEGGYTLDNIANSVIAILKVLSM